MIEVSDLVFEYPTARALHGVSVTINDGAIAALVGPNGAGKTTLLRCIAALERPYSGTVRVDGLDVQVHPRRVHARIGYLPDFYGLYDELSVLRVLVYAARARGVGAAKAKAAATGVADRVGIADRLDDTVGTLSRGLRQRLAIGQALVHEPHVLLLDEPASGLDPEARRALSQLLLDLQRQGMTLVVSSHILAELEDYASEMIILDRGRMVGGTTKALGETPKSLRMLVELADGRADLGAFLTKRADVSAVAGNDTAASFDHAGDRGARAGLLKALVGAGFPVCTFAETKRRLEDVYFDEVEAGRRSS